MSEQWSMQVTPTEMYQQNSADLNYDYPLHHYPPPPPVECYPPTFHFDVNSYPNLPPAPNDLFTGYPQVYPPVPHPSISQGHQQMFPPSLSEYPSNGTYPWGESPPSSSQQRPASIPPLAAPAVPHCPPDDDQRVQQELLELLGDYHAPVDNFYAHPQVPMYDFNTSGLPGSAPSPYSLSGHDYSAGSPQSSLVKPCFDEDPSELEDPDELELDLEDLPNGVTETDLSTLKIPDLNKKLRDLGLSREDQNLVKKIRRQHKNRRYAHTCRQKKVDKKNTMKVQKQVLETEINELKLDVDKLRRERDEYKKNYEIMQKRKLEMRV